MQDEFVLEEMEDAFERSDKRVSQLRETMTGKEDTRTLQERKASFFKYRERVARIMKELRDEA